MKNDSVNRKFAGLVNGLYKETRERFFSEDFVPAKQALNDSLSALSKQELKGVITSVRQLCKELAVETRVSTKADVSRLLSGAAYWSYLIREFAMVLALDEKEKKRRWVEVEEIAVVPIQDLGKLSEYFDTQNPRA